MNGFLLVFIVISGVFVIYAAAKKKRVMFYVCAAIFTLLVANYAVNLRDMNCKKGAEKIGGVLWILNVTVLPTLATVLVLISINKMMRVEKNQARILELLENKNANT